MCKDYYIRILLKEDPMALPWVYLFYLFVVVFVVRTQRTPCKDTALTNTTGSKVENKTILQHEKPDEYKELKVINTLRTNMPHMFMPA